MNSAHKHFQFGEWQVNPAANSLAHGGLCRQVEPRAMDVLQQLCQRRGQVLSAEQLLDWCWGNAINGDNPVHKVITQLRKALGDSSTAPRYIETIRKRGYRAMAAVLYSDDDEASASWLRGSPFRGLQAFEEEHAAIFFGRKQATAQLLALIQAQSAAGCAMALVLGPSGSGKTSLVRAGVLPRLDLDCKLYLDLADTCEGGLLPTLGSVLLDGETAQGPVFEHDSAESLGRRLQLAPADVVAQLRERLAGQSWGLFVDRFEAIFRQPGIDETQRLAFIGVLEQLARSGHMQLILACRNDFYPHLAHYGPLMQLKLRGGHFDMNPPDKAEIAQIIRRPAQAAQLRFESDPITGVGLDEVLCAEAQSRPDILPLLQYCMQELYRRRGSDGALRYADLRALGGIEGALGARAEQATQALSPAQLAALPRVLSRLVSVSEEEMAVTSRHRPWSVLQDPAELELVKALVEARLFTSDLHVGVATFGIAHDALLRRWPRVLTWIASHRDALQLRTRISVQAARWQASGRSRDFLLPGGAQANQARELLQSPGFPLAPLEREFIEATLGLVRRGARRRAFVLTALGGLALLASLLGLQAQAARRQAEQHRIEAEGLMGYMLGEFTDKLRPLGRLDLLDSVSARALAYLAAPHSGADDAIERAQRAKALQVIAEVKIARGDPAGATQALQSARTILQTQWERQQDDPALLKALGTNAFWLGQIQVDQRNWDAAEQHFQRYLAFSDRLAAAVPRDVDGVIEQSYAHSNLGTVALKRGAVQRAAEQFEASLALKSQALARVPARVDLQVDRANSLSWLASARAQLGQIQQAMALYRREAELMSALHSATPGNALWTQRYAFSLWHQADLQVATGQPEAGRANFLQAEALLQAIVRQDPSNRSWQSALYTVQLKLLDLQTAAPAAKIAALQDLQERLAVLITLEPKKWNLQRLTAQTAARRAELYWGLGQQAEAQRLLMTARSTLERLQTAAPGDPLIRQTLAETLLQQAEFAFSAEAPDTARHACAQAAQLLQATARASADFQILAPWVQAARCLGQDARAAASQLSAMHYQDPRFTRAMAHLPTHQEKL